MTSNPEVVGQLLKSMYVDDVISGAQDEQQVELLYLESKKILKDGDSTSGSLLRTLIPCNSRSMPVILQRSS